MTFVTMKDADDLAELERRLERFHRDGVILAAHPGRSVLFENSCRWIGHGACGLLSLRRLQVLETERVTACRDSGDIGQVGDSYDSMVTALKQRKQIEEVRRGCATCPVRDQCSQCVHLPQTWGGRYCEIRKAYPQCALYFAMTPFPSLITQHLKLKSGCIEVRTSYTGLPAQHYKGPVRETRPGQRPVIATAQGQHLAWWPGTRRLVRLSAPLAMMAEAWWSDALETDVTRALRESFNVEESTAISSLAEGSLKLKSEGIIHA
jgi:hypothetical protein